MAVPPPGWQNPITALPGQIQREVDPQLLLPSRRDLIRFRLEFQRKLLVSGLARYSPIEVTPMGVIWDGHHAARAAAEEGRLVEVLVVGQSVVPSGVYVLDLHVR